VTSGDTHEVIRTYLESDLGLSSQRRWDGVNGPGDDVARLVSVRVLAKGNRGDEVNITDPIDIEIEYWSTGRMKPAANLQVYNDEGTCLFGVGEHGTPDWNRLPSAAGLVRSTCRIPGNFLAEGRMTVSVAVDTFNPHIGHAGAPDAVAFQVVDRTEGDGVRGIYVGDWPGVVRPKLDWTVEWRAQAGGPPA
jgi:lipopolysaccharide transport system ATP-binding protein